MEKSNYLQPITYTNKKIIIVCLIVFLLGFMIGSAVGAYQSMNWAVHKFKYFIEITNTSISLDYDRLTHDLFRYKYKIDSQYP